MQVHLFKYPLNGRSLTLGLLLAGGLIVLGLLAFVSSRYQIDILISPLNERASESETALPVPPLASNVVKPTPGSPLWNPNPQNSGSPRPGTLRVSNQTQHPIRLVLLEQPQTLGTGEAKKTKFLKAPAHWDFAPGEGSAQGLVVSLPEGSVSVKPGDISMAYAQDGTLLDWGPHVVSQTTQPVWNSRLQEWQFILRP